MKIEYLHWLGGEKEFSKENVSKLLDDYPEYVVRGNAHNFVVAYATRMNWAGAVFTFRLPGRELRTNECIGNLTLSGWGRANFVLGYAALQFFSLVIFMLVVLPIVISVISSGFGDIENLLASMMFPLFLVLFYLGNEKMFKFAQRNFSKMTDDIIQALLKEYKIEIRTNKASDQIASSSAAHDLSS